MEQVADLDVVTLGTDLDHLLDFGDGREVEVLAAALGKEVAGGIADGFAADMLLNGAAERTWPRKIGAEAWFGFRNCDRYEVEEQSFMLRGDEVLTVLNIPANGLG